MIYNKTNWKNNGQGYGAKAGLANIDNAISSVALTGAITGLGTVSSVSCTSYLDMSANTAGFNVGFGDFDRGVREIYAGPNGDGFDDKVIFTSPSCAVYSIEFYNTATKKPIKLDQLWRHTGIAASATSPYLTWESCGRISRNIEANAVIDQGAAGILLYAPGHGLPTSTEGLRGYLSSGGFLENNEIGTVERSTITYGTITDPDWLPINKTMAQYEEFLSQDAEHFHAFMDSAIMMNGGGIDFSQGASATCYVTWAWDPTHPLFYEALASDG
jgi:hypothetical protein